MGNSNPTKPSQPLEAQVPTKPTSCAPSPPLTPSELLTLNILIGPNPLKRALRQIRKRLKKQTP